MLHRNKRQNIYRYTKEQGVSWVFIFSFCLSKCVFVAMILCISKLVIKPIKKMPINVHNDFWLSMKWFHLNHDFEKIYRFDISCSKDCLHNQRRRMLIYRKTFTACFQNILETTFQKETFIKWNIYPNLFLFNFLLTNALFLMNVFI